MSSELRGYKIERQAKPLMSSTAEIIAHRKQDDAESLNLEVCYMLEQWANHHRIVATDSKLAEMYDQLMSDSDIWHCMLGVAPGSPGSAPLRLHNMVGMIGPGKKGISDEGVKILLAHSSKFLYDIPFNGYASRDLAFKVAQELRYHRTARDAMNAIFDSLENDVIDVRETSRWASENVTLTRTIPELIHFLAACARGSHVTDSDNVDLFIELIGEVNLNACY